MIDLHTHTNYSDGTWNVKKLLEEAQNSEIEILSITDHDTLDAYKELQKIDYKKIYTGKIIKGIELSTVYDGIALHMLAYDFNYDKLENWVYNNYKKNKINLEKEFMYMIQNCKKNNIKMDDLFYNEKDGWPVDVIFNQIKKYEENRKYFEQEEWNNIDVFYNSCITNKNFPAFVDFSIHYPNAKLVNEAVKAAGGKLFIAHIYKYKLKEPIKLLDALKNNNLIDGIEVEHSSFSEEQTNILKEYCVKNNLLMSGGTDCHGEKKADRKIGIGFGNMEIDKKIIEKWYKL